MYSSKTVLGIAGMLAFVSPALPWRPGPASAIQAQVPIGEDPSPHSAVSLFAETTTARPGEPFTVAVRISLDPGWHSYWINGGDAGLPLGVQWDLPEGFSAGALQWPVPKRIPLPPLMSYGYENELLVLVDIETPSAAPLGSFHVGATADWLVCEEICLPAMGEAGLELRMTAASPAPDPAGAGLIEATRGSLPRPTTGWTTRGWSVPEGWILEVEVDADDRLPAPYFFVDEIGVVEHAAAQRVVRDGRRLRLLVSRSEFAGDDVPPVLRGVLAADAGEDHGTGWDIQFPLLSAAPGRGAVDVAPFFAPEAELTGGTSRSIDSEGVDAAAGLSLWVALSFAFLGGLALNLMPCVFPVLSVKVLGLIRHAGESGRTARRHGLAFGAGVLLSLWALAGALLALRAAGEGIGWGFQLQSPPLVAVLALLMFALALNLAGVFEIGMGLTRLGAAGVGASYADSLVSGGLAVIVATPCTAPFMGAALGYALVQPATIGLMVFTMLGIGLALPYVILSATPRLLGRLPAPGAWMVTFRQLLAFPMFATVVWLAWVLGRQVGVDGLALLLLALTLVGLGAWVLGRPGAFGHRPSQLAAGGILLGALALAVGSARIDVDHAAAPSRESVVWEPFSLERVATLRASGTPVFIDFTAAWCLSCQVNERVALSTAAVHEAFAGAGVALLKADWTNRDPAIADVIRSFGRGGVPLYVLYPEDPDAAPEILPALLTPGMVIAAVRRATESRDRSALQSSVKATKDPSNMPTTVSATRSSTERSMRPFPQRRIMRTSRSHSAADGAGHSASISAAAGSRYSMRLR